MYKIYHHASTIHMLKTYERGSKAFIQNKLKMLLKTHKKGHQPENLKVDPIL